MFNLIIGLNHTGSQIISQGSKTRNLWTYNGIMKLSIIPFTYRKLEFSFGGGVLGKLRFELRKES